MHYDVFGIGNALMDFLLEVPDSTLKAMGFDKGMMKLVSQEKVLEILETIHLSSIKKVPGGSSANATAGVASLGGSAAFCGKVGSDKQGTLYKKYLQKEGVTDKVVQGEGLTGIAITFVTPDGQRSFATHLGVAGTLTPKEIPITDITNSTYLHVEGYAFMEPPIKEAALAAMDAAKKSGVKISLDLSSSNVIDSKKEFFTKLVEDAVDILFVNEEEAASLTGKKRHEALHDIADIAEIAVVKLGEHGSILKHGEEVLTIPAHTVDCIDTTGAGDMYAAGILYGLTHGKTLEKSARIASMAAAKIVEQMGARPPHPLLRLDEIRRLLNEP